MVGGICIGKVNVKFRAKTTDTYVKSACNKPQHVVSSGPEEPGDQGVRRRARRIAHPLKLRHASWLEGQVPSPGKV